MRILVVSDLHGDLGSATRACAAVRPDMILSCGDWLTNVAPVHTTFGNHDALELLARLSNRDGSPVLLAQGEVRDAGGLRIAAIGGIWAKSHKKTHYVTDADVAEAAARISRAGPVDILLTHGCPIGLADLTPTGRHGGQRCFLDAFKTVNPRLHLCGHIHLAQERNLKDGRKVINVGATPEGSIAIVEYDPKSQSLDACLETLPIA
jgi:uncharacterized protein